MKDNFDDYVVSFIKEEREDYRAVAKVCFFLINVTHRHIKIFGVKPWPSRVCVGCQAAWSQRKAVLL